MIYTKSCLFCSCFAAFWRIPSHTLLHTVLQIFVFYHIFRKYSSSAPLIYFIFFFKSSGFAAFSRTPAPPQYLLHFAPPQLNRYNLQIKIETTLFPKEFRQNLPSESVTFFLQQNIITTQQFYFKHLLSYQKQN